MSPRKIGKTFADLSQGRSAPGEWYTLAFAAPLVRAESITYTYTGTGSLAGTIFTYLDPNGFLSLPTGELTPTTAGDVFYEGDNYGQIFGFSFASDVYTISIGIGPVQVGPLPPYDLDTFGTQNIGDGNLNIEPTVAATPEPSSLLLLATGGLALLGATRRRLFNV